jgi:hypothetical protein
MRQEAPYPAALAALVTRCRYKDHAGWRFWLEDINRGQGSTGLTLIIERCGPDTYDPENVIRVHHYMLVPPAAYDARSWMEWLFDQIMLVELHEAMEEFKLIDAQADLGEYRPYAPSHGPGNNPYIRREPEGTDWDRRIRFTGEVSE